MSFIKKQLLDNRGDVSVDKMLVLAIVFVIGALALAIVWSAVDALYANGISSIIHTTLD